MKRIVAGILISLGVLFLLSSIVAIFTGFDPKGTGSIFFAAFILLIVGWMVGDF
ncbi:MAG: hypothetical protein MI807_21290 [Verrucomicrobiales bacterium]|nr:hypothetical protein [Verrucomicrobiales bacterium]